MNSFTIALNIIKRTIGTKKGVLAHIFLPCIVIAAVVGLLGREEITRAEIAYVNEDTGVASEYLLDELANKPDYVLKSFQSEEVMKEYLIGLKGSVGVMIPSGFTEGVLTGNTPILQTYEMKMSEAMVTIKININNLVAGMSSTAARVNASAIAQGEVSVNFSRVLDEIKKHRISAVDNDLRLYPKPGITTVTGFTLMFLMGLVSSTVTRIVEDRSRRTMARVFSAPVRAWEIALGNFLGSFIVGLIQIVVVLFLTRSVLNYDYGVSVLPHFLVLSAFMLVAMGLASAVAGLIRNPQNTGTLNSLIIIPTSMIGGCFWPISFMPDIMQKAANFVPQKWAIEAVENLSAGAGMQSLALPMLILGLMAVILLAIGSAILRPSETSAGL
ncbi:ABC-2 type transport system permease protein [Paenibacillus anaericanus]|uniref:ABC transporter permease n=1 Tax=Paenibacillus anaericanus TaxID=170367 RepID=UPI002781143D|nr:ABC transporter permease [Paenibacillus anaericanus]MDQ0089342.1 ABC-2 type transport system permease protein [Paenibacillus anaericanus]